MRSRLILAGTWSYYFVLLKSKYLFERKLRAREQDSKIPRAASASRYVERVPSDLDSAGNREITVGFDKADWSQRRNGQSPMNLARLRRKTESETSSRIAQHDFAKLNRTEELEKRNWRSDSQCFQPRGGWVCSRSICLSEPPLHLYGLVQRWKVTKQRKSRRRECDCNRTAVADNYLIVPIALRGTFNNQVITTATNGLVVGS